MYQKIVKILFFKQKTNEHNKIKIFCDNESSHFLEVLVFPSSGISIFFLFLQII